jgi:hypothetical protein
MADDDPVEVLRRWEDFGAVWQVVRRHPDEVTVALCRCDGGEEVSRLVSGDPRLLAYVAAHERADVSGSPGRPA